MEEVDMVIEKTARQFDLLNESDYTKEQCRMLLNEMKDRLNILKVTKDIHKPLKWLNNKFKISKGETYTEPNITIRQCASWIGEYVNEYFK